MVAALHRGALPQQEPHQLLVAPRRGELQPRVAGLVRAVHGHGGSRRGGRFAAGLCRRLLGAARRGGGGGRVGGAAAAGQPQEASGGLAVALLAGAEEELYLRGHPALPHGQRCRAPGGSAARDRPRRRREGSGEEGTRLAGGGRPRAAAALRPLSRGGNGEPGWAARPGAGQGYPSLGPGARRLSRPAGSRSGAPAPVSSRLLPLRQGSSALWAAAILRAVTDSHTIVSALGELLPGVMAAGLRYGAYSFSPDTIIPFSCFTTRFPTAWRGLSVKPTPFTRYFSLRLCHPTLCLL